MRWSKTKMLIENLLCEKLKNRLYIYATSYQASFGEQRRIWITLDGKEIFQASSAHFLWAHDKLWEEAREKKQASLFPLACMNVIQNLLGNFMIWMIRCWF